MNHQTGCDLIGKAIGRLVSGGDELVELGLVEVLEVGRHATVGQRLLIEKESFGDLRGTGSALEDLGVSRGDGREEIVVPQCLVREIRMVCEGHALAGSSEDLPGPCAIGLIRP